MANAITIFKKYIDLLDEVYKNASKTAVLDSNPAEIQQGANAGEYVIPKMSMQGLGDYSRNGGYVSGDVTLTNETVKADFDRGRKFTVDAMDNEETAGVAFGKLSAEFVRTKVVPEVDAYRMAIYASKAGSSATGSISTGDAAIAAIRVGNNAMDDAEVPEESRFLFITPTLLGLIEDMDTTKSRELLKNFEGRIVKMPQSRFYTIIDQLSGGTGEEAGSYVKHVSTGESDPAGQNINFMLIEKSAIIQYDKHVVSKIITPEENQNSDGWLFAYRNYGIDEVYENKTAGIYLHSVA